MKRAIANPLWDFLTSTFKCLVATLLIVGVVVLTSILLRFIGSVISHWFNISIS